MTQALIRLTDNTNRVLNIVKARYNLKDKSEAIEAVVQHYIDCSDEPEFRPDYVEKVLASERGKFIKVKDFPSRYKAK